MSLTEIEEQLEHLTPDELRRLALRSWSAFVRREDNSEIFNACDEDDTDLLTLLDIAVIQADASPSSGYTGDEIRQRISEWNSK
jgi:transcriptional regulator of aromatic amino acid metabolism